MSETNPYASPLAIATGKLPATSLERVCTLVTILFGGLSTLAGIAAVVVLYRLTGFIFYNAQGNPVLYTDPTAGQMIGGCALLLGFGISWLVAGWAILARRKPLAWGAAGVGLLFPVVLGTAIGTVL